MWWHSNVTQQNLPTCKFSQTIQNVPELFKNPLGILGGPFCQTSRAHSGAVWKKKFPVNPSSEDNFRHQDHTIKTGYCAMKSSYLWVVTWWCEGKTSPSTLITDPGNGLNASSSTLISAPAEVQIRSVQAQLIWETGALTIQCIVRVLLGMACFCFQTRISKKPREESALIQHEMLSNVPSDARTFRFLTWKTTTHQFWHKFPSFTNLDQALWNSSGTLQELAAWFWRVWFCELSCVTLTSAKTGEYSNQVSQKCVPNWNPESHAIKSWTPGQRQNTPCLDWILWAWSSSLWWSICYMVWRLSMENIHKTNWCHQSLPSRTWYLWLPPLQSANQLQHKLNSWLASADCWITDWQEARFRLQEDLRS